MAACGTAGRRKGGLEYISLLPEEHRDEAAKLLSLMHQKDNSRREYDEFLRRLPEDVKKSVNAALFSNGLVTIAAPDGEPDYKISPDGVDAYQAYKKIYW